MARFRLFTRVAASVLAAATLAGCASSDGFHRPGPGGGRPPEQIGPSVDEIVAELALSPERAAEVRGVLEASEDERDAIMAKHAGARGPDALDAAGEELENLRARTEAMLEPLLTEEQMARYREIVDEARAERERAMEERRARGPAGPRRGTGRPPGF